mmetsp:Transcript_39795/g.90715  ORF Transcript_39795/g.90715 Transcript_39795/m.90715 type:complete len:215 (+) Transcript_39795:280-924(+)
MMASAPTRPEPSVSIESNIPCKYSSLPSSQISSSSPSSSATAGEKAAAAAAADAGRKWWGPRSAGAQEVAGCEARAMAAKVAAQDTELATLRAAAAKVTETQVAQRDVLESVQRTNRSLQRRQEEMEEMVEMRVMAAKVEAKDVTVAALELAVALRAELKESSTAAAVTERKAVAEVCGLMDERDSILAQHSALAATSAAALVQLQDVQVCLSP